jgi:hypothetical protein
LKLQQFGSLTFILPTKKTIAHGVSYSCFGVLMQDAVLFVIAKIGWKTTLSHCLHLWRIITIETPAVWLTYFCLANLLDHFTSSQLYLHWCTHARCSAFCSCKNQLEDNLSHRYHLWRTITIETLAVWLTYFCLANFCLAN